MNKELLKYIGENVFPKYGKNDAGHGIGHVQYVIRRSLEFAKQDEKINIDMVYTVACYHDIGHHIDPKNHAVVSAEILFNDKALAKFFDGKQIMTMAEAVEDHRASMKNEPRNIYGKIVSSADRSTSIDDNIRRIYQYRLKNSPEDSLDEMLEDGYLHFKKKFGADGYAKEKMFFADPEYSAFLKEAAILAKDKEAFRKRFLQVINQS